MHYGTQMIELAKGKYSIEVADEHALIAALEAVKQAVETGELDSQINAASEQSRRVFELGVAWHVVRSCKQCLTISTSMQISEVTKPPSPQQQRVDQLRTQLDAARRVAKQARLAQQQIKLNQQRLKLNQTP